MAEPNEYGVFINAPVAFSVTKKGIFMEISIAEKDGLYCYGLNYQVKDHGNGHGASLKWHSYRSELACLVAGKLRLKELAKHDAEKGNTQTLMQLAKQALKELSVFEQSSFLKAQRRKI